MAKSADAFRTISEVADWLGVQTHVLRFWESKFTQVKPVKRAGGRRYYRPVDMQLLGGIQKLLHEDGLTIKGVQKILREKGMAHVSALSPSIDGTDAKTVKTPIKPAPFEEVSVDETEDTSADVVPFIQESRKTETTESLERPSFTQDAVVMPQVPTEPALEQSTTETNASAKVDEIISDDISAQEAPNVPKPQLPEFDVKAVDTAETEATAEPAEIVDDFASESPLGTAKIVEEPSVEALAPPVDDDGPVAQNFDATSPESDGKEEPAVEAEPETSEAAQSQTDDEPEQVKAAEEPVEKVADEPIAMLPSFLSRSTPIAPTSDNLPPETEAAQPVPSLEEPVVAEDADSSEPPIEQTVEAPKPTPQIIDVPDTPNESEIAATPRALSALARTQSLTAAQANAILPLLAKLRDVRDRMSTGRKE
ncbi:MAG: DNA-binding transcriptional MerR regulator [Ascidiaceihabitans sp.]|jgi:DNA-binding transcriptional MerR regulator